MQFQVGRYTVELSLDDHCRVSSQWFLRNGRKTDPPKYLDAADRRQYRAGRDAFLRTAGKLPARLGSPSSWRALRRIAPALLVAAAVADCARGGGIGLEAVLADHNCEAAGYQLGTPEYTNCRMALSQQSAIRGAAAMASQESMIRDYLNRQSQMCSYNGSTIGGITGGTMTCR